MSERFWQPSEPHPPRSVLFLYVEGELDDSETALVRQHLADCWDCRARCEDLEKGIHDFVSARRDVLIPRLPPPPRTRQNFFVRLKAEDEKTQELSFFDRFALLLRRALAAPPRSAWLPAAVSLAITVVIVFFNLSSPPKKMTAMAFFEQVRKARTTAAVPAQYIAVQKVQFRQGSRTLERQVVHGASRNAAVRRNAPPERAEAASADSVLTGSLAAAHIDLDDPLNADAFERWHDSLTSVEDRVTQTAAAITLVAKPAPTVPILLASLEVRAADWHPIAERFEFSDEPPLEVREISWELRREAAPEIVVRLPEIRSTTPPSAEPEPSDADLERSELSVREVMHQLGADRTEVPEIVREDHRIDIWAITDSDERREQLMTAIVGIPYVYPEVGSPGSPVSSRPEATPATPRLSPAPAASYPTTPPLAKQLWDYKGSMDVANNYLDTVRESYFHTLADANLLSRLAQRYPEKDWDQLPPDVQARITRLAADYIQAIQNDAPDYLRRLSDPLDEMLRRTGVAASLPGATEAGCAQWQPLADLVVADLQLTQTSFRRLFVVDQTEVPLILSADTLLPQPVQLRSRLNEEVKSLCSR